MYRPELTAYLARIAEELIEQMTASPLSIREGVVMTTGPAPYRRLDCDGRALAYIRTRPKKRAVRVDITGLWRTPRPPRLAVANAGGATTLLIRTEAEAKDAVRFLERTVERTRTTRELRGPERDRPSSAPTGGDLALGLQAFEEAS